MRAHISETYAAIMRLISEWSFPTKKQLLLIKKGSCFSMGFE